MLYNSQLVEKNNPSYFIENQTDNKNFKLIIVDLKTWEKHL